MAFDSSFFHGNRQKLLSTLGGEPLIVLSAYSRMQRKADAAHVFEQEGNFWYLSGIEEPDWTLMIDGTDGTTTLVEPKLQPWQRVFDGALSHEEALATSGADRVVSPREAQKLLATISANRPVYTVFPDQHLAHYGFTPNPAHKRALQRLSRRFDSVLDCRTALQKLRSIKQDIEVAAIRKAVDITAASLNDLVKDLTSLTSEREVEAFLTYGFMRRGADGHAYDPIVASGRNACVLHYTKNRDELRQGDLLLLDVGAKVDGYCADVTRTLTRSRPTARQADVYASVARVHDAAMKVCRPDAPVSDYQSIVHDAMAAELEALGLVDGKPERSLYTYFPHAISHGLGIDVHDSLGGTDQLKEGMVLTVEPGIYIAEEGIGIRIENDILITKDGFENLSASSSYDFDSWIEQAGRYNKA